MIIVGYIIREGTSFSRLAPGDFVGERSHEAKMGNLQDPALWKPQLT